MRGCFRIICLRFRKSEPQIGTAHGAKIMQKSSTEKGNPMDWNNQTSAAVQVLNEAIEKLKTQYPDIHPVVAERLVKSVFKYMARFCPNDRVTADRLREVADGLLNLGP
jgi:hypothetical protein